jgi:hypothetical protein
MTSRAKSFTDFDERRKAFMPAPQVLVAGCRIRPHEPSSRARGVDRGMADDEAKLPKS